MLGWPNPRTQHIDIDRADRYGTGCASRKPQPNTLAMEETFEARQPEPEGLRFGDVTLPGHEPGGLRFVAVSLLRHKPGIRWLLARHRNLITTSQLQGNLAESA